MDHPCFFCGGAAHPATGHQYSERVIACLRCAKGAFAFVKGHVSKKAKGGKHKQSAVGFYDSIFLQPHELQKLEVDFTAVEELEVGDVVHEHGQVVTLEVSSEAVVVYTDRSRTPNKFAPGTVVMVLLPVSR